MFSTGDWIVVAFFSVLLAVIFHGHIFRFLASIVSGRDPKHSLYSEMHSLLEISIKQNTAIIEMRDLMRAWLDTQLTVLAINQVRDAIRDYPRLDMEPVLASLGQAVALLMSIDEDFGKVGECIEEIRTASSARAADGEAVVAKLQHLVECAEFAKGPLASMDKQSSQQVDFVKTIAESQVKILAQLDKNDQRLFEFVNATKHIMKAISGEGAEDDDILIDEARKIKASAADQGIELTLEDCIKRARAKMTYNGR